MRAEIVIIGGGVIGTSVAYHLARRGCRDVLVLDRGEDLGAGSTSKATGGFRLQFDNETEVRLSQLSREKLLAFEEETGIDSGYRPYGYLFLACNPGELELLRAAQTVQHACGVTEARMVGAAEARELSPVIAEESIVGGTFCPSDGFIRPMNILRGYRAAAERLGVRFVHGVEHLDFFEEHGKVVAARTSAGSVQGSVFVEARGAWSGAPVTPLRRNAAATVATDLLPESTPMTIWAGDWYHLRVRDGRVLLLWPDDPCVDDWLEQVQQKTRERVPSLAQLPIAECWTGLYEMTPDGHALLGASPLYENLFLATGCSGHGVMHSPAVGHLLAELITEGWTSIDVTALRPDRFSEG